LLMILRTLVLCLILNQCSSYSSARTERRGLARIIDTSIVLPLVLSPAVVSVVDACVAMIRVESKFSVKIRRQDLEGKGIKN